MDSTSNGEMSSPPRLITSFDLPTSFRNPSPSNVPRSPVRNHGPWFRTGDLGTLDGDGFLKLVGRSKEVINRGGELISPFEVESMVMKFPGVRQCMAFSA